MGQILISVILALFCFVYLAECDALPEKGISHNRIHVRKCCRREEAFLESQGSCGHYELDYSLPVYSTATNTLLNVKKEQINFVEGLLTSCAPSILSSEEFVLFDTGELFSSYLDDYFQPNRYCVEHIVNDTTLEAHTVQLTAAYCPDSGLPETFDPSKIPVRKCCLQDEIVISHTAECVLRHNNDDWTVAIQNVGSISSRSKSFTSYYEVVSGYPECTNRERGETFHQSNWLFEVLENIGQITVPSLGVITPNYCIDDHIQDNNNTINSFMYVCLDENSYQKYIEIKPTCTSNQDYCIEKCCPRHQLLNKKGECVNPLNFTGHSLVPFVFSNGTYGYVENIDFNLGSPACASRGMFLTKQEENIFIMDNGTLQFVSTDPHECKPEVTEYIPRMDYCYDMIIFESEDGTQQEPVPGALICYPGNLETQLKKSERINFIYSIFLLISDIFILISFIIYLTVPDQAKRGLNKNIKLGHSVLGRIILSFLFSLFVAYLCLIITKNASESLNLASNKACIGLGIAMYVAFLATFFWLNILCFELWWKCARQERTSGRRWLWYQLYAWGMPLFLGSIVLYIEFSPSIGPCFVKPNFGVHTCFFSETRTFGSAAKWLYLNGPISILLIADLFFFMLTVKSLMQTVQQSHAGTVKRQARQRLKLCFKLFLVMGICWMTEIISAATSYKKWYIAEIFNCLQGFVIFLIFIMKPKIMHAIKEKLCTLCCGQPSTRDPRRGRKLTFTASILSEFLSSNKRPHPSVSSQNLSNSSFSTTTSHFSWGSNSSKIVGRNVDFKSKYPKITPT